MNIDECNSNKDVFDKKNIVYTRDRHGRSAFMNIIKCAALAVFIKVGIIERWKISRYNDIWSQYPTKYRSDFVIRMEQSLSSQKKALFTPLFITNDRKLLCPQMEPNTSLSRRVKNFAEMIRSGLPSHHQRLLSSHALLMNGTLPLLLMGGDGIGCDVTKHIDEYGFPRLTWSVPSHIHNGDKWCNAISVPSFEVWRQFAKVNISHDVETHELDYPWSAKLSKIVWRGSTTHNPRLYGSVPFQDIPRAKLVQTSINDPDVIDAAFTKIHQRFANMSDDLEAMTRLVDRMDFDDQMKYRGEWLLI